MNKQQKLVIIIFGVICLVICYFTIGYEVGKNTRIEKLEQELCKLEQYKYCTKEELLKLKTTK